MRQFHADSREITSKNEKKIPKRILIIVIAAVAVITAAIAIAYTQGLFLPGWINWENTSLESADGSLLIEVKSKTVTVKETESGNVIWELPGNCKTQSALVSDIDGDGRDELLVLCWRIGRYGRRRPFWVKHDEITWSQHIYIYDMDGSRVKAKWMASDIGILVDKWMIDSGRFVATHSPDDTINTWAWISWGLERIPEIDEEDSLQGEYLRQMKEAGGSETDLKANTAAPDGKDSDTASSTDESATTAAEATEVETTAAETTEVETATAEVVMAGDILLHTGVAGACKDEDGEYDFHPLFENTKDVISGADVAIVNEEVIIGGKELGVTGYPSFNAPYELGDALVDAGFDVICHATNHALDKGKKGLLNCLNYWQSNYPDIDVIGIYGYEEASNEVCITEVNGIKIAVLNYTYGTNGIPLPSDMPFAVNLLTDKDDISEKLRYAEENADFTVVCPHWGVEYQLSYNNEQKSYAEFFVENGADLIIATHPHVIEQVEWVEADNGNKGLCYYSLGNFINWTSGRGSNVGNRMVGALADVTVEKDPAGNTQIASYEAIPIVSHVEHERGKVTTYLLENYTQELAESNAIKEQDTQFSLDYCHELWERVMGD